MNATRQEAAPPASDLSGVTDDILALKNRWGTKLVILTHHYQRPEIVAVGDVRGDSFELAREAAEREGVEHIVFCGVLFMAEAAAVVARPDQRVYHPSMDAGCPLADHADAVQVQRALEFLQDVKGTGSVMPITYMNSDVEVKAVVGQHGGSVCTSANARTLFEWGLSRRPSVLFVPDEHLGHNTAESMGIPDSEVLVWDPHSDPAVLDRASVARARAILWRGHCHVHTWFRPDHVTRARLQHPEARIHVHPECRREVARLADGVGSTRYLVNVVGEAPSGAVLYIGTEINLVARLALEHPDKTILPLARSLCPNMYRITLRRLRDTLAALPMAPTVTVDQSIGGAARTALTRMLEVATRGPSVTS